MLNWCLQCTTVLLSITCRGVSLLPQKTDVERYVIININTRLSLREKSAVDHWITSGKIIHVMRDHPSHSQYATNSGTRGAIPNMHSLLLMQRQRNRHTENMTFLNTVVWMKAKSFVYHHDSFSCGNHGIYLPFPTNVLYWSMLVVCTLINRGVSLTLIFWTGYDTTFKVWVRPNKQKASYDRWLWFNFSLDK